MAPPQVVLQGIKKSFEEAHWDAKTIEIHQTSSKIPQQSPGYYINLKESLKGQVIYGVSYMNII